MMQSIQRSNEARRSVDGRAAAEPEADVEAEAGAKVEPVGESVAAPGARAPHAEGRDGPPPGGPGKADEARQMMQSIQRSNEARRSADGRAAAEPEAAVEAEAGAEVEPVGESVAAPGARAPHAEGRDGPPPGGPGKADEARQMMQ